MQEALPAGRSVEVFYDGDCPLCMREIRMLMRKDKAGRIVFTDIADPGFDEQRNGKDLPRAHEADPGPSR